MKFRARSLGLFLAIATLSAGMVLGQATNSASVTGTITDSTGAVIPGVTVTVTDVEKNTRRVVVTNDSGVYQTGPLVPTDHYTIVFKKAGFSTLQRGPMVLYLGQIGLNVQMGVAQTTQQVVVNEAAPLLQTTSPELSATLPQQTLHDLPQVGTPDWQQFIVLLPGTSGVQQNGNNAANPGMGGISANGSMPFSTALLDGATTSSPMSDNVIHTPIFDSIAEVKIIDNLFSAQYGTGGILYNQISKSGTNQFHGEGYLYDRNTAMNAASYGFGTGFVPPVHYNDFGFNVGGPVIKNRVFFFFDYDRTVNHNGSTSIITVPTDAMKTGDFTGFPTIYDPTTETVSPSGVITRQSFASEYGNGNKIPAAMIDPVAKAIQKLFPEPLPGFGTVSNGVSLNNYATIIPAIAPQVEYFGRFDADVGKSHHIDGSAAWNNNWQNALSPVCPVNCLGIDIFNTNNQISDDWTISPTLINTARLGFMGEYDLLLPQTMNQNWPQKLGLQFAKANIFPNININGWYGLDSGTHSNYKENLFDLSDVVTMIHGRHSLSFGGELIVMRADSTAWGNINGATLGFSGVYTEGWDATKNGLSTATGSPYADFLLGYSNSWSAAVSPEYGGRQKDPAAFIQDDWKVTPKLTVNLGLRWEGRTGWSDVQKNQLSFDPHIINPATNAPGAMWYDKNQTNGRTTLQHSRMNNWLPRIGFAYQLGTKTVLSGGFGIYTFPWNMDTYGNGEGNALRSSGNENDSTNGAQPVVILSSDGNTNYQGSVGKSINALYHGPLLAPDSYNGQGVGYSQYQSPVPMLKSWNFTVQRSVSSNTMVSLAYVGSRGTNLAFNTDLNQVPASELGPNDAKLRPYPEFQSIGGVTTAGLSNYNSLQAMIARRMSNGLEFNFNYTWSHMLSNQDSSGWGSKEGTTIWQNAYVPSANYGNSNFDIPQMFKSQVIYTLPFGHGQKFLNSNAALNEALGGWTLSGTYIAQDGNPFTPYMLVNNSYTQTAGGGFQWFPNVVGNPKRSNASINEWFNVNAFQSPTPGTLGNMHRNSVFGPGLQEMNTSLHKNFPIWERVSFDFSVNATNVLNHPSFSQPDPVIGPGHTAAIRGTTVGGRNMMFVGKIIF